MSTLSQCTRLRVPDLSNGTLHSILSRLVQDQDDDNDQPSVARALPDLVLTMAINYGPEGLRPLLLTWAAFAHENTRVVLLTDQTGMKDLKEFIGMDPDLILLVSNATTGPVSNRRLHAYKQYLTNHRHKYNRVIFTDSRDVMFQRNPFRNPRFPRKGEVGFTLEGGMRPIGLEHYNAEWIVTCYGEEARARMEALTISCSGFIMCGDVTSAIQYVDTVLSEFAGPARKCIDIAGADQGVHNYIAYMRDTPFTRVFLDNEVSPCYTMGGDFTVGINGLNQVLNQQEQIVDVIHQYDRRVPFVDVIDRNYKHRVRHLTRFQTNW